MKTEEPSFLTLARQPNLDQEIAFTICRMINSVGWELAEDWDWNWLEKARDDYRSLIEPDMLEGAWKLLFKKDWLSLQTTNDVAKRISNITPLDGLTNLRTLVLQNNLVQDLQPVSAMVKLKELNCICNRVSDLRPIVNVKALEELSLLGNPIESFGVLEHLPELQRLSLSTERFPLFAGCVRLPRLRKLTIAGEGVIEKLSQFPQMPALKVLFVDGVQDLSGIERYSALENLSLSDGAFASLEPLRTLKFLTHLAITTAEPVDLMPLAGMHALRAVTVSGPSVRSMTALRDLPVLRHVLVNGKRVEREEDVPPWSSEFKDESKTPRPSLDLQVVDQQIFDYYDTHPYGVGPDEFNEKMLGCERDWLIKEICQALSVKFEESVDFDSPAMFGMRRSDRVIVYTMSAYEAFREFVTIIQSVLSEAKNDWIIYFQSLLHEGPEADKIPAGTQDFIIWIYPNKIMVAEKHADVVRNLMDWRN